MNILLSFIALIAVTANAAPIDELVKMSWEKSQLIKSQKALVSAAELDRFARFLPNNPTISYADSDNKSWKTYGATLQVGFPGQAFALHKVDNVLVKSQEHEVTAKKIEITKFVVGLYTSCASSRQLLAVLSEAVTELNTLKQAITARYEMGQSTQAERIGIELQYRQADIENKALIDQSRNACVALSRYLKDNELDEAIAVDLPQDLSPELLHQLGSKSIDIIRAENESRISEVEADVAFWRAAPDLNFGVYRNYYNKVVASPIVPVQWTTTYMVSMNIPILFPVYERNEIRRARAQNFIAAERARLRILQGERELLDATNEFNRSRLVLQKLVSRDLPMAETMIDSTFAAYKQGKLGFSELILAKRTWLDLKKEEVQLKLTLINNRLTCLNSCERN